MDFPQWLDNHGFDLLEAVGIIASLILSAASFQRSHQSRRISNLISLSQAHREIWKEFVAYGSQLARIREHKVDLTKEPVTNAEETFIVAVVQHLGVVFRSTKIDLTVKPEQLERDVVQFFQYPVPKAVWNKLRTYQDGDLVKFVDNVLSKNSQNSSSA